MFDPEKSSFDILMEVAITTVVFAALLFLVGLASDPETCHYSPLKAMGISLDR